MVCRPGRGMTSSVLQGDDFGLDMCLSFFMRDQECLKIIGSYES